MSSRMKENFIINIWQIDETIYTMKEGCTLLRSRAKLHKTQG